MYRGNPRLTGVVQGRGPHHLHGVKWHLKAPVFAISSLAAAQHMLYFGGSDGSLFAVDAEQGTVQWQFELSHPLSFCPVGYTPAIERGIVYYPVAGEQGSFLYAIDAQPGQ